MKSTVSLLSLLIILSSCGGSSNSSSNDNNADYNREEANETYDFEEDEYNDFEEVEEISSGFRGFEDDVYSAEVDYYNPETDYNATYTLDVEVEDNHVTIIYFPNNGYLDDDHIWPDELDDGGFVSIEGEDGKTYDIQIDY